MNFKELLMKAKQGEGGKRGTVFDVPSHGVKQVQNQRNLFRGLISGTF